jgi:hypothetical protein
MDVPLKFALPLLLLVALPAGFAVLQDLSAASSRMTPAATRAAHVRAPDPLWHQDQADVPRQADEAIAIGRARQAAAQAERDQTDFRVVLMPDQKMIADTFYSNGDDGTTDAKHWKEREEQRIHDKVVRERMKLESTRAANCASSRWHCERP